MCEMVLGWGWIGSSCELISGCGMGDDAPWFYESENICNTRCTYEYDAGCIYAIGDINGDGVYNVLDVVQLVNIILSP